MGDVAVETEDHYTAAEGTEAANLTQFDDKGPSIGTSSVDLGDVAVSVAAQADDKEPTVPEHTGEGDDVELEFVEPESGHVAMENEDRATAADENVNSHSLPTAAISDTNPGDTGIHTEVDPLPDSKEFSDTAATDTPTCTPPSTASPSKGRRKKAALTASSSEVEGEEEGRSLRRSTRQRRT
jgi:hypothetical protein